ncbi:hypothetical protein JCM10207_003386 [Rhodosporidiobolus poonsookiae]
MRSMRDVNLVPRLLVVVLVVKRTTARAAPLPRTAAAHPYARPTAGGAVPGILLSAAFLNPKRTAAAYAQSSTAHPPSATSTGASDDGRPLSALSAHSDALPIPTSPSTSSSAGASPLLVCSPGRRNGPLVTRYSSAMSPTLAPAPAPGSNPNLSPALTASPAATATSDGRFTPRPMSPVGAVLPGAAD